MSPRKTKREAKGQKVTCCECNVAEIPVVRTRETVELRARTSATGGTLTDVKLMKRKGIYTCDHCVMLLELGLDPKDPRNRFVEPPSEPKQMDLLGAEDEPSSQQQGGTAA